MDSRKARDRTCLRSESSIHARLAKASATRCDPSPTISNRVARDPCVFAVRGPRGARWHIQVFLAEKHFEGCGGLVITDEARGTIAPLACVLLLHRETDYYYPNLVSILVYPTTYLVPGGQRTADGLVAEGDQARLGESWARDAVVLAWDSVLSGAADIHDGHNVVLHEFAHQLDQEGDASEGAPPLPRRSMYVAWARVLGHDFDELVRETAHRRRTLLDRYGATNPAEFFAVATETFFEKPRQLRS